MIWLWLLRGGRCTSNDQCKPGRKYEESVKLFEPYGAVKEPYPEARAAGAALIKKGIKAGPGSKTFIFVNNRLEGNALDTIAAMVEESGWQAAA